MLRIDDDVVRFVFFVFICLNCCSCLINALQNNQVECNYTSSTAQWRESCNWCRCIETRKALCTRRGCPPALITRLSEGKECKGDAQWKRDCNWCSCNQGRAICTNSFCGSRNKRIAPSLDGISFPTPKFIRNENETECVTITDDGGWRKNCNWCRCDGGKQLCTRKLCHPGLEEKSGQVDCNGKVQWKKGCETCHCVDGYAVCAPETCTPEKDSVCKSVRKGSRFRDGCNWCACRKGLPICTKIGCKPGDPRINTSPACEGDILWKKGCNWCRCVNGEAKCAQNPCDDKCQEGASWVEGCNTCICSSGLSLCTRKACHDPITDEIQPAVLKSRTEELATIATSNEQLFENCTEGSEWKRDCNWCKCKNGSSVCSEMECLTDSTGNVLGPHCVNGSQWKEKCNICKCTNGIPMCTEKVCEKEILQRREIGTVIKDKIQLYKSRSNETCSEGSRWKNDCNWCFCNNGHGLCTFMRCLSGIGSDGPQCTNDSQWLNSNNMWCHCDKGKAICSASDDKKETLTRSPLQYESSTDAKSYSPKIEVKIEISSSLRNEPMCKEGSRWVNLCNWCTCANGVGLCEQKACSSEDAKTMDKTCIGKSKWKDNCNWCICQNGKGNCTTKDCNRVTAVNDPPNEECEPGNSWLQDCNICVCTNRRGICTKMECKPSISRADVVLCSEGKEWKEECNACRCHLGEKVCTREFCPSSNRTSLSDVCYLPAVNSSSKLCADFESRWTFNAKSGKCETVIYGGCGGTENLFRNEQECITACGNQTLGPSQDFRVKEENKERCFMPIVPGPCFAQLIRYAFFPERSRCEEFYYGGCQGNQNNFITLEECYRMCGGSPLSVGDSDNSTLIKA